MPFLAPAIPAVAGALMGGGGGGEGDADDLAQQKIWNDEEDARKRQDFSFGGKGQAGADAAAERYRLLGANAGNQAWTKTDYSGGDKYMGLGDQARGQQGEALGLMRDAARGTAPSQAAILMRQGNDQAVANQLSMAAGARGPAAMAMAQQQAMGNQSVMSTTNQNNMGALRAHEMESARAAYMGGATGMRGQDYQGAGMMDSRAQYGGDLELRRRALQQQGQLAYEGMGYNVDSAQMGGNMARRGADDAHWQAQMGADASSRDANARNWGKVADTGVSLLKSSQGA